MDYEIKKVLEQHKKIGLPIRDKQPDRFNHDEAASRRRGIRVATDGLVRAGIQAGNLGEVAVGVVETMTAVAGACVQFGLRPELSDALTAARELLEDARIVIDNGLALSEPDQAKAGACMLEIVCVGIATCFSVPYKRVFDLAHEAYMQGQDIDRTVLNDLLQSIHPPAPDPAANDASPLQPGETT